jgi:hypothetical protein
MGILFFNWYGYQLLSMYWQDKADRRLEASIDRNNFDESQLISIRIPITSLSYYNSSAAFERVDGQVEIDGIQYKYVKRRLFKDSLELLCIRDQAEMKLRAAKEDFFRQVNDLQQHATPGKKTSSHNGPGKGFSKDYCSDKNSDCMPGISMPPVIMMDRYEVDRLPSLDLPISENPPDMGAAVVA